MDPLQIKRLQEEHEKGLQICQEKIRRWEKFKADYEALKQRLETLPDCLSYDVTVPFGNNAFTMGKIVHTNEVMVLLGDNWFAEVSAKEAAAIASRRITQCSSMLEDLSKERLQFENWLKYIGEVSGAENLVEIIESYDENKEKEWREQHAKNVKAYRQNLAESKKTSEEESGINSDEEYRIKLENLALKETEVDLKEVESDRSTVECSDEGSQYSEEQPCKPALKLHINCNNFRKSFSESETGDDIEDNCKKKDMNANLQECNATGGGKHVRWQDLSKQNIKKITFKHSKSKNKQSTNSRNQDSSEGEDHPLIQSPSDIYKRFGNFFQSSPPKSILKVKNSPSSDSGEPFFPTKEPVTKENSSEMSDDSHHNVAFTGQVCERSSPIHIIESKSSRPTSHFKSSRKNRKR